ncbi:dynamin family protein [Streptoalloteichus hindustanus]|uniref:Dynamin family protein n=1 Tax=Streptoalloteichus hindustanus TaxID=2017 RepID=A0A1M5Q6R3_STRHI|nr:dynamin family protein [Streptoalloteichus hindustanus]SHH09580.1 Dynamin family protein [Streptoalloteichus hindustanus]
MAGPVASTGPALRAADPPATTPAAGSASPWLAVLDETIGVCEAHRRQDLAHGLRRRRAGLLAPHLRVVVVGMAKQGKSQLVNALVNAPVCAVGDDVSPSAATVVQHAETPSAVLVARPAAAGAPPARVPVPVDQVAREVGARAGLLRAEVGIPRALLASGLSFVDTPPLGDPTTERGGAVHAALADADAVVLVSDATGELTGAELDLLRQVAASCPAVLVALTKIDLVTGWRQVLERNRARLAGAGLAVPQLPVSAALRLRAADAGDRALNGESGFPELLDHLRRSVVARRDQLARWTVAVATTAALEPVVARVRAEVALPSRTGVAASRLEEAQRQLEELRRRSGRCHQVLADEMADLTADIDHDLRERTRGVLREVDRVLDEADPLAVWEILEDWLGRNLSEVAEASSTWLVERCEWIAEKVALGFPAADARAPAPLTALGLPADEVSAVDMPKIERFTAAQKAFIGLKGSYGGVLMFGLVTSLAGLPMINPLSLGAGAAFAGKSVRDESRNRLQRRQTVAKAAVQRHVDDFFLRFGKECRDAARHVHRVLRDHLTALTEELQERIVEGVRRTKEAANAEAVERDRRNQELQRLLALDRRARALAVATRATPLEITA